MFDEQQTNQQNNQENQSNPEQTPVHVGQDLPVQREEEPQAKPPRKKTLMVIAVIIGVIVIGGGSLLAAKKIFNLQIPLLDKLLFWQESPEQVMNKMIANLQNIKSVNLSLDAKFNSTDIQGEEKQFNIFLTGKQDVLVPEESKFEYIIKMNNLDSEFNMNLNFKYFDEIAYIKLSNLPEIPFFDLSELSDKWFSLDKKDTESLKRLNSSLEKKQDDLNEENKKRLMEALKNNKIYKIKEVLKSEKIDSISTYHYLLSLDKDGILNLVKELEEISKDQLKNQSLPVAYPEDEIKELEESLKKIEDESIEIWIDKKTYYLRKIQVDLKDVEAKKDNQDIKANIFISLELSKINEPTTIEAPEKSESLDNLIQGMMGGFMSGMPMPGQGNMELNDENFNIGDGMDFGEIEVKEIEPADNNKDSDKDGLKDNEEVNIYGTDPNNPDSDGDGYFDGAEVENGYNPNGEGMLLGV